MRRTHLDGLVVWSGGPRTEWRSCFQTMPLASFGSTVPRFEHHGPDTGRRAEMAAEARTLAAARAAAYARAHRGDGGLERGASSTLARQRGQPAVPRVPEHGSSGIYGLDGGTFRQLQSLQSMQLLYRAADRNAGVVHNPAASLAAAPRPALSTRELASLVAELSNGLDRSKLSFEHVYTCLTDAQLASCSINAWYGARQVLAGQYTSAFDILWFSIARNQFDRRLRYAAHAGRWSTALAELLLVEFVFMRPDDSEGLASCDLLIRAEILAISLEDSGASPQHIDRMLRLCPRLLRLDLRGSLATDGNIATLLRYCPDLQQIRLSDTRLGGDAVQALLAALPGLAIDI